MFSLTDVCVHIIEGFDTLEIHLLLLISLCLVLMHYISQIFYNASVDYVMLITLLITTHLFLIFNISFYFLNNKKIKLNIKVCI